MGTLHGFFFAKKKKKGGKKKKGAGAKSAASKGPEMTPAKAEAKREAIKAEMQAAMDSGEWLDVAERFESEGAKQGDPVLYMQAAVARLKAAEKERSIERAEEAITTARVALDILHFYADVDANRAESKWLTVDPSGTGTLIEQTDALIGQAQGLISEIEAEAASDDDEAVVASADKAKKKKKRKAGKGKPGTALIATGSAFTALGLVGAGLGITGIVISRSRQQEVEGLTLPDDQARIAELDAEGRRANVMGYAGLAVAMTGLAVGIPLIAIGAKRRKTQGETPANASVQILPMTGRNGNGVVFSGRF